MAHMSPCSWLTYTKPHPELHRYRAAWTQTIAHLTLYRHPSEKHFSCYSYLSVISAHHRSLQSFTESVSTSTPTSSPYAALCRDGKAALETNCLFNSVLCSVRSPITVSSGRREQGQFETSHWVISLWKQQQGFKQQSSTNMNQSMYGWPLVLCS